MQHVRRLLRRGQLSLWKRWRLRGMGPQKRTMQPAQVAGTSMGRSLHLHSHLSPTTSRWRNTSQDACLRHCAQKGCSTLPTAAEFFHAMQGGDITVLHVAPLVYWTSYMVHTLTNLLCVALQLC